MPRSRQRPRAGLRPGAPAAPAPSSTAPAASSASAEGSPAASPPADEKRVRATAPRKRKQHGTLYRWVAAYLPLMAVLFGLLAVMWVWVSFISPPPPKPADRWQQIETKWTPDREKARAALSAHYADFTAQLADYKAFYDATKGWLDDVQAFTRWKEADTSDTSRSPPVSTSSASMARTTWGC